MHKEYHSSDFENFANGVLFNDIEFGLNVLWSASFINGRVYKENLGFIVPNGLLIIPNKYNTQYSSKMNSLPLIIQEGKLLVEFQYTFVEVLGIIHTHPNEWGVQSPTPTSDYQYSYLGIHNYILSERYLFDAYKDNKGRETFDQIDAMSASTKILATLGNSNVFTSNPFKGSDQMLNY